jgi:hypothetical protein
MSKGTVYVRNPIVYRILSFRIQMETEPLGNTCLPIHLSTVYTLSENPKGSVHPLTSRRRRTHSEIQNRTGVFGFISYITIFFDWEHLAADNII